MDKETQSTLAGLWQGRYMDVRGYEGQLELQLKNSGDQVDGIFHLSLLNEGTPNIIRGKISGSVKEGKNGNVLHATILPQREKHDVQPVSVEILLSDAGSYAEKAMYASFTQQVHPDLTAGVWMAWRFTQKKND